MKIYHVETQEDYDALMVELRKEGIKTFNKNIWIDGKEKNLHKGK